MLLLIFSLSAYRACWYTDSYCPSFRSYCAEYDLGAWGKTPLLAGGTKSFPRMLATDGIIGSMKADETLKETNYLNTCEDIEANLPDDPAELRALCIAEIRRRIYAEAALTRALEDCG